MNTPRLARASSVLLLLAATAFGCGHDVATGRRTGSEPGTKGGGAAGTGFGNAGGAGSGTAVGNTGGELRVHVEDIHEMSIEVITLACAGDCADIVAVAHGGNPPYAFAWDDGSTEPARHVCLDSSATLSVDASDTAIDSDEFHYDAHTATARVTARVLDCSSPDGGAASVMQVTVPGTSDLWLAGQPDGTQLATQSPPMGMDVVPQNAAVEVPVTAGNTLTFIATGATSNAGFPCPGDTPDGTCFAQLPMLAGPASGLSALTGPLNSLAGVFLDDAAPSGTAPAALDFTKTSPLASLSPELRQTFWIGDGVTGNGSGTVQAFVVPAGATRLFLASFDATGSNYNNTGDFTVIVRATP